MILPPPLLVFLPGFMPRIGAGSGLPVMPSSPTYVGPGLANWLCPTYNNLLFVLDGAGGGGGAAGTMAILNGSDAAQSYLQYPGASNIVAIANGGTGGAGSTAGQGANGSPGAGSDLGTNSTVTVGGGSPGGAGGVSGTIIGGTGGPGGRVTLRWTPGSVSGGITAPVPGTTYAIQLRSAGGGTAGVGAPGGAGTPARAWISYN